MRFDITKERQKQLTDKLRLILKDTQITTPTDLYNAVGKICFAKVEEEFLGSILTQMGILAPGPEG